MKNILIIFAVVSGAVLLLAFIWFGILYILDLDE